MERIVGQTIKPGITTAITSPVLGGLLQPVDNITQVVQAYNTSRKPDKAKQQLDKQSPAWAWLPGKAGSNRARRRIQMQRLLTGKARPSKLLSEIFPVNFLLPTVAGAIIGGVAGGSSAHDKIEGITAGATIGAGAAGVANLLGTLLAAIKSKRSLEKQKAYEESSASTVGNFLIPGMAPYNYWKSIGALNSDAYKEALEKKYKKEAGK